MTNPIPASSAGPGSWVSTTTPMIVAVAGSRDSSSANVARDSRASASWSHTYGITDEQIPTPAAAASSSGCPKATAASATPTGAATIAATSIASPRRSMPAGPPSAASRLPSVM